MPKCHHRRDPKDGRRFHEDSGVSPVPRVERDIEGRVLIAHEADGLKDQGCAALCLRSRSSDRSQGGLDALFQGALLEDNTGSDAASLWAMETAYGLPAFGGRCTCRPHAVLCFANITASTGGLPTAWP